MMRSSRPANRVMIGALVAALWATPGQVFAAAGEMPSLVQDIGISLLTAGLIALIFTRFRIPSIAAFLLAGVIVGPLGLEQVTNPDNIDTIAQLGFILLLFLIGLEIDFKKVFGSGKAVTVSGLLQYPLTIAFGVLAVKGLLWLGFGGDLLASSPFAPLYLGVVIAGSSTLLVIYLTIQICRILLSPFGLIGRLCKPPPPSTLESCHV